MTMNKQILTRILTVLTAMSLLIACPHGESAEKKEIKGGNTKMKTYMIGRFAVDIPEDMKLTARNSKLRYTKIEEYLIPPQQAAHEKAIEKLWNDRLKKIKGFNPPEEMETALIETRAFPEVGRPAKCILHYGDDNILAQTKLIDVLLDAGSVGVWFKNIGAVADAENVKKMTNNVAKIANSYQARYPDASSRGDWFYLEHGAIYLPYRWQEKAFARFEGGPHHFNLSIDMNETFEKESPSHGLLGRVAAALMTGFAMGVNVDRIRSEKRVAAGLKGEEEVDRMSSKDEGTQLSFIWRYAGEVDSGERPKIVISMESPDGNIDEKLKIWDAILDSFKPMYSTR